MTSGGLSMTEGWNLQLQARVRRLEMALHRIIKFVDAVAPGKPTKEMTSIKAEAVAALATISDADIAGALGEPFDSTPTSQQALGSARIQLRSALKSAERDDSDLVGVPLSTHELRCLIKSLDERAAT